MHDAVVSEVPAKSHVTALASINTRLHFTHIRQQPPVNWHTHLTAHSTVLFTQLNQPPWSKLKPVLNRTWIEWNHIFSGKPSHSQRSLNAGACINRNSLQRKQMRPLRFPYRQVWTVFGLQMACSRRNASSDVNVTQLGEQGGTVMGWTTEEPELVSQQRRWVSCYPPGPDRLRGPPSLLPQFITNSFFSGLRGQGVKQTSHLHLVPKFKKYGAILPHRHPG